MRTPPAGYQHARKAALFLAASDELWRDGQWVRIKRITVRQRTVAIKLAGGVKIEVPQDSQWYTRRPAQWIAPSHTGTSPGMPPGAGRP